MNREPTFGLYLYKKPALERPALKDLLQFLRTVSPAQGNSFSYVAAETSLHPHLSLWENLQLEAGIRSLRELQGALIPEHQTLVNLLSEPSVSCREAQAWERFLVSFVKGLIAPSRNLLVDMNEEHLPPHLIQSFKKNVLLAAKSKTVFLASANTSLWLDCAHSLVRRRDYEFHVEPLDGEIIRKSWGA
jgi:hypothetical protein